MTLLERTRKINSLLQQTGGKPVNFNDMAKTLSEVINGNVFVVRRRGKLLGVAVSQEIESDHMKAMLEERRFHDEYMLGIAEVHETTENIEIESPRSEERRVGKE